MVAAQRTCAVWPPSPYLCDCEGDGNAKGRAIMLGAKQLDDRDGKNDSGDGGGEGSGHAQPTIYSFRRTKPYGTKRLPTRATLVTNCMRYVDNELLRAVTSFSTAAYLSTSCAVPTYLANSTLHWSTGVNMKRKYTLVKSAERSYICRTSLMKENPAV